MYRVLRWTLCDPGDLEVAKKSSTVIVLLDNYPLVVLAEHSVGCLVYAGAYMCV